MSIPAGDCSRIRSSASSESISALAPKIRTSFRAAIPTLRGSGRDNRTCGLNPSEYCTGNFARSRARSKSRMVSRCEMKRRSPRILNRSRYRACNVVLGPLCLVFDCSFSGSACITFRAPGLVLFHELLLVPFIFVCRAGLRRNSVTSLGPFRYSRTQPRRFRSARAAIEPSRPADSFAPVDPCRSRVPVRRRARRV